MTNLNAAEFKQYMEDHPESVLIDVRSEAEYSEGKIEGHKLINVNDPTFYDKVQDLDPELEYLVYCRSGGRSVRACQIMESFGIKSTFNLLGGIGAWNAMG